jgi:hypothetical protein
MNGSAVLGGARRSAHSTTHSILHPLQHPTQERVAWRLIQQRPRRTMLSSPSQTILAKPSPDGRCALGANDTGRSEAMHALHYGCPEASRDRRTG